MQITPTCSAAATGLWGALGQRGSGHALDAVAVKPVNVEHEHEYERV